MNNNSNTANSGGDNSILEKVGAEFSQWIRNQLTPSGRAGTGAQQFRSKQALIHSFLEYYKNLNNHKATDLAQIKESDFNALLDVLNLGGSTFLDFLDEQQELSNAVGKTKPEKDAMNAMTQEITDLSANPLRINGKTIIEAFNDYIHHTYPSSKINSINDIPNMILYQRILKGFLTLSEFQTKPFTAVKAGLNQLVLQEHDNTQQVVINAVLTNAKKQYQTLLQAQGYSQTDIDDKIKKLCHDLGRPDPKNLEQYDVSASPVDLEKALQIIKQKFDDIKTEKNLTDQYINDQFKQCRVSNQNIFDEFNRSSSLSPQTKQAISAGNFQSRNNKTQRLFSSLLKRQIANKITTISTTKTLESTIDVFASTNGSLKQILRHYPVSDADATNPRLAPIDIQIDALIDAKDRGTITPAQIDELKQLRKQKEQIRRDHYIQYLISKDPDLGHAFDELRTKRFDTYALSAASQRAIMQGLARAKIDEIAQQNIALGADLKPDEYKRMITDLLDPDVKTITIPSRNGDKQIKFKNKQLRGSLDLSSDQISLDDPSVLNKLQMILQVDLDDAGSDFESLRKILPEGSFREMNVAGANTFQTSDGKNKVLVHEGMKVSVAGAEGYLSPIAPFADLDLREQRERNITGDGATQDMYYYLYDQPVNLPADPQRPRSIVYRDEAKRRPIIIKKDPKGNLTRANIDLGDGSGEVMNEGYESTVVSKVPGGNILNISGNGIGALLRGSTVLMSDASDIASQMKQLSSNALQKLTQQRSGKDKEKQKTGDELEQAIENNEFIDSQVSAPSQDQQDAVTDVGTLSPEALKQLIKDKIKGSEGELRSGDVLYFQSNTIQREGLSPQVDGWIRATVTGSDSSSLGLKLESFAFGSKTDVSINITSREDVDNMLSRGSKWMKHDMSLGSDMPGHVAALIKNDAVDGDNAKMRNGMQRDSSRGRFKKKEKPQEDVMCFSTEVVVGSETLQEKTKQALYHYERLSNGNIQVKAQLPKPDNTAESRTYTKTMSYPDFLIFVSTLKLQPRTKSQVDLLKAGKSDITPDTEGRKTKRLGLRYAWKAVKSIRDDGIKKYYDDYDADQTEKAKDRVFMHSRIGKGLQKLPIIGKGFKDVREDYEDGFYNRTWEKIEKAKKGFVDAASFGAAIADDILPLYLGKKNDSLKLVGALLALLEKGQYPLINSGNTNPSVKTPGQWILRILGQKHYDKFEGIYNNKLSEAQKPGNTGNSKLQNDVMKAELQYIIDALNGDLEYDNKDEGGNIAKSLQYKYSKKLSGALNDGMENWFTSSKALSEDNLNKKKGKTFAQVMNGFFSEEIGKGKTAECITSLKAMAAIMVTDDEIRKFQMCMVALMLSGLAEHELSAQNKGTLGELCRRCGLPIANRREDIEQRRKISTMLDYITKGSGARKFSTALGYDIGAFDSFGYRVSTMKDFKEKDGFFARFKSRWLSPLDANGKIQSAGEHVSNFMCLRNLDQPKNIINVAKNTTISTSTDSALKPEPDELQIVKELEECIMQFGKKDATEIENKHISRYAPLSISNGSASGLIELDGNGGYKDPSSSKKTQMAQEYLINMKKNFDAALANPSKEVYQYLFSRFKETCSAIGANSSAYAHGLAYYRQLRNRSPERQTLRHNIMDTIFMQQAKQRHKGGLPSEMSEMIKSFTNLTKKALDMDPPLIDGEFIKSQFGEDYVSSFTDNLSSKKGYFTKTLLLPSQFEAIIKKPRQFRTEQELKLTGNQSGQAANLLFENIIKPNPRIPFGAYSYVSTPTGGGGSQQGAALPRNRLAVSADGSEALLRNLNELPRTDPSGSAQQTSTPFASTPFAGYDNLDDYYQDQLYQ